MVRTRKTAQPLTTAQQLGSIVKSSRDIMRKDKGLSGDIDRLPMLTWIMFLKFLDDMDRIREEEAILSGEKFRPAIALPYRWRDWAAREDGITGDELIAFVNNDEAVRPDGTRGSGLFAYLRGLQGANGGDRRDVVDYVVVELKTGPFRPEYAGKLNFYLSAVDDMLRHESDAPSIGLILCKDKNHLIAEYALRDIGKPVGVSEYCLVEAIPEELKGSLPTIEELESELAGGEDE